jgi:hypothetical protein
MSIYYLRDTLSPDNNARSSASVQFCGHSSLHLQTVIFNTHQAQTYVVLSRLDNYVLNLGLMRYKCCPGFDRRVRRTSIIY